MSIETKKPEVESTVATREDLELQKLSLEVEQLQQPWWKKPAYILAALPTVLAIGSLLIGIFTGYFQAIATKLENQRHDIEVEIRQFDQRRTELHRENEQLLNEQKKIISEMDRTLKENQELRQNLDTVGKCLQGIAKVADVKNTTEMAVILGAIDEPCSKADAIVNKLNSELQPSQ